VPDVVWEESPQIVGGNLSYLHKVVEGREVYFFANSSDSPVDTHVRLRGTLQLEQWDPHTGKMAAIESAHLVVHDQPVTRVRLSLAPVQSTFLVGAKS
jgi:hypothetical protein